MDLKILSGQTVNSEAELKYILDFLEKQGFGYFREWDHHQKKIEKIIRESNTLNVKYNSDFDREMMRLNDYIIVKQKSIEFFSKFNPIDKINELMTKFYIIEDDSCRPPSYSYPSNNDVIKWVQFRLKYNLKDEFEPSDYVKYYNLDKKILKIHYGEHNEFTQLYRLLYNEECKDFPNKTGDWFDIGKLEIKFFANGNANIKGDLKPFTDYYYKYLLSKKYNHNIIVYNKKIEIYKTKRED